jgi:sugar-specific transcriptional regulator TrmB
VTQIIKNKFNNTTYKLEAQLMTFPPKPMFEDKYLSILRKLDLSLPQAKSYLALTKLEEADVATIAKTANLARQEVYRQMPRLMKLGLVEKVIGDPIKYRSTPLKRGTSKLMREKKKEHIQLQIEAKRLMNGYISKTQATTDGGHNFILTSEWKLIERRYTEGFRSTETSIEAVGSVEASKKSLDCWKLLLRKMKKGVRFRLILTEFPMTKQIQKNLQKLLENLLCEIRWLSQPPSVTLAIFDHKKTDIVVSHPQNGGFSNLGSDNICIVNIARTYFEEMWSKAQQIPSLIVHRCNPLEKDLTKEVLGS